MKSTAWLVYSADPEEPRIPGPRPPSPGSVADPARVPAGKPRVRRLCVMVDLPALPKRRVPHEDDGRREQPDTARPHPQLLAGAVA